MGFGVWALRDGLMRPPRDQRHLPVAGTGSLPASCTRPRPARTRTRPARSSQPPLRRRQPALHPRSPDAPPAGHARRQARPSPATRCYAGPRCTAVLGVHVPARARSGSDSPARGAPGSWPRWRRRIRLALPRARRLPNPSLPFRAWVPASAPAISPAPRLPSQGPPPARDPTSPQCRGVSTAAATRPAARDKVPVFQFLLPHVTPHRARPPSKKADEALPASVRAMAASLHDDDGLQLPPASPRVWPVSASCHACPAIAARSYRVAGPGLVLVSRIGSIHQVPRDHGSARRPQSAARPLSACLSTAPKIPSLISTSCPLTCMRRPLIGPRCHLLERAPTAECGHPTSTPDS